VTTGRYLVGVVLLVAAVAPVVLGARSIRTRVLPGWRGPPAWVADVVVAVTALIAVAEVLGVLGILYLAPLVAACVATGAGMIALAGRLASGDPAPPPEPSRPPGRLETAAAWAAGALVLSTWSARVATEYDRGMTTPDTVWQHLPAAARFVQDGSIRELQYFDREPFTVFYPFHSSLLHAEGILLFGSDVLSPVLNLGWLALALVAAWALGRPVGAAAACTLAVAVVLASPILVSTQAGGAYTDVIVIALVLASFALIANGGVRGPPLVLAATAAGLALGTKYTAIPTVAVITVGVVALADRGRRARTAAVWIGVAVLAGGFWYARNLVHTGSPMPAYDIPFLPNVTDQLVPRETVAHYLENGDTRRAFVEPALDLNFGPAWRFVIGLSLAGMVASLLSRERLARLLAITGLVSAAAYVFSPLVLGTEGFPYLLKYNVRYVTLAIALGLVALARRPGLRGGVPGAVVLWSLVALLVVTQTDDSLWPAAHQWTGVEAGVALLAVAALMALLLPRRRGLALGVAAVAAVAVAAGGALVHHDYLRDRYTRAAALRFKISPVGRYWEWARSQHDERIAVAGDYVTYPMYGDDLTNRVEYMGHHGAHGGFTPIDNCPEWRRALNDGHFDYVMTSRLPEDLEGAPPAEGWTRTDASATEVATNAVSRAGHGALFRVDGPLHPRDCPKRPLALTERDGRPVLRLRSGTAAIRPGAVSGYVETRGPIRGGVQLSGWAADRRAGRPAERIVVLEHGRLLASGEPTLEREDIAADYGPGAARAGFRVEIEDPRGERLLEPGRLRVYAVSGGRASELRLLEGA
jgi:hypothetical protein